MKFVILGLLLSLFSCASFKNPRAIKEANFDGLKYESLHRYDALRLDKPLKSKDPLAMCHYKEYNKANEVFKKKLDKNLNNYMYWNQISTCYILQKEYTQARRFLDLAMNSAKTKKQKSIVLNNVGVILLENARFHEAKNYFKESIKLNNKSLTPRYNLSQIYLKFGLYGKANSEINYLLKQNKKDIDFLNSKAHLELMRNDYKTALVYFNRIPAQYRSRDDIATNMAMTYFMLGLFDNAKNSLNNADKKDSFYTASQLEISKKIEKKLKK